MKEMMKGNKISFKVAEGNQYVTERDLEMDKRAKQAVKAALSKAEVCNKPIAKYDATRKKAFLQYPDGRRVDV